ncbi:MAG: hypothetical protein M1820_003277 [Bogoriella megaspora]|nr:MAG: hypothetical protein M1820_003277 [Bogoriella megaspora]
MQSSENTINEAIGSSSQSGLGRSLVVANPEKVNGHEIAGSSESIDSTEGENSDEESDTDELGGTIDNDIDDDCTNVGNISDTGDSTDDEEASNSEEVSKAEKIIQKIRRKRHVEDKDDWNAGDLSRSLDILADTLYSTQTHFLFELVQNADDLEFSEGIIRRLMLIYRDNGYLWVSSNKIGFQEPNVTSICRLSLSIKGVRGEQKGQAGEKGIGFNPVFKVADQL